jgi:hypothetical protein
VPSPLYVNDLNARITKALAEARNAHALDHPGLTGTVREIVVRDLIEPILPPNILVGTGKVIDHIGNMSDEIDIVVYDRSLLPPIMYGRDLGVFPVEACLYAVQVKSRSTATHLKQVVAQGRSLAGLTYLREACGPNGNPIQRVMPAYFAFSTDLKAPDPNADEPPEITRWRAQHCQDDLQLEDGLINGVWQQAPFPPLRVLCVAGQGYGYYTGQHYAHFKAGTAHQEILAFITGIANTLLRFSARRLPLPFGYYLGGPSQPEVEAVRGSPEEAQELVLEMAKLARRFDSNDATRAVFDGRLKYRGPDARLGNIAEVQTALAALEASGKIRRIELESPGPHTWEYVGPRTAHSG